jgi:membrane-associated phospholipid phosphatase
MSPVLRALTFPNIRRKHPGLLSAPLRLLTMYLLCYAAIIPAYLALRGIADDAGAPRIHGVLLGPERLLGLGETPSERLQDLLWNGSFGPLEWAGFGFYASFFFLPWLAMAYVALVRPKLFPSFTVMHVVLLFGAGLMFLAFPAEPPWMALGVERIILVRDTSGVADLDSNQLAAFPSLHVGWIAAYGFWLKRQGLRWLAAPYAIAATGIGLAVVYFGEHYVLDVVAGIAVAYGAAWLATSQPLERAIRTVVKAAQRTRARTPIGATASEAAG